MKREGFGKSYVCSIFAIMINNLQNAASLQVQYIHNPPQTTAIPTSTMQAQPIPTRFPSGCPTGYTLSRGMLPDSPASLFQQRPSQVNYF